MIKLTRIFTLLLLSLLFFTGCSNEEPTAKELADHYFELGKNVDKFHYEVVFDLKVDEDAVSQEAKDLTAVFNDDFQLKVDFLFDRELHKMEANIDLSLKMGFMNIDLDTPVLFDFESFTVFFEADDVAFFLDGIDLERNNIGQIDLNTMFDLDDPLSLMNDLSHMLHIYIDSFDVFNEEDYIFVDLNEHDLEIGGKYKVFHSPSLQSIEKQKDKFHNDMLEFLTGLDDTNPLFAFFDAYDPSLSKDENIEEILTELYEGFLIYEDRDSDGTYLFDKKGNFLKENFSDTYFDEDVHAYLTEEYNIYLHSINEDIEFKLDLENRDKFDASDVLNLLLNEFQTEETIQNQQSFLSDEPIFDEYGNVYFYSYIDDMYYDEEYNMYFRDENDQFYRYLHEEDVFSDREGNLYFYEYENDGEIREMIPLEEEAREQYLLDI